MHLSRIRKGKERIFKILKHRILVGLHAQSLCLLQLGSCSPRHLLQNPKDRASLVAQWLRIRLPMQGTRVRALVGEDPTCCGPTKPVCHNYWACALEPVSHNYWAHEPQLLKPTLLEPAHRNEEQPLLAATRESLCTATKTQCSQK